MLAGAKIDIVHMLDSNARPKFLPADNPAQPVPCELVIVCDVPPIPSEFATVYASGTDSVPIDEKEPERLLLFSHQECADDVVIPIRPSGFVYV